MPWTSSPVGRSFAWCLLRGCSAAWQAGGIDVYAPRLFLAEVAGVLVRFLPPSVVRDIVKRLRNEVMLVGDDIYFAEAVETALATGSRGADSYYIGLARILNAPLATSDRVQALNARRSGARAFYILDKQDLEVLLGP